ncbi:MAG: hypothetical protein CME64_15850 [Halobacteriovoraceae bacterium]|nr:hypothetical protein [Halobacteriovoraceae bacterium]|tara:strand:- start:21834 stop:22898 length:1065 start_codon:yes stop_codon:yes gene_type:complete
MKGESMKNFDEQVKLIFRLAQKYNKYPKATYWLNLLATAVLAWGLFIAAYLSDGLVQRAIYLVPSIFALYRLATFTHEVVHIKKGQVPGFRLAWSVLCGIPLLAPHFMYRELHLAHHSKNKYNTDKDIEYFPFFGKAFSMHTYYFKNLALPFLSLYRFAILPLTFFVGGKIRNLIEQKASCMGIRFVFTREKLKNKTERKYWVIEEMATFIYVWSIIGLITSNNLAIDLVYQWAVAMVAILTLNTFRFLSATHLYWGQGEKMTFEQHIMDSVNIKNKGVFAKLIAPVGQTYHGLHHIVPFVPGLELHKLHKDIMSEIDESHFYHKINYEGFLQVYGLLLKGKGPEHETQKLEAA